MTGRALVARVMIDSPLPQLDRLFDYALPHEGGDAIVAGVRVKVPLHNRMATGFVVELAPPGEYTGELSAIEAIVSPVAVLAPEVWALARRLADRAAGTASDVIRLAVPKRQARVEKVWSTRGEAEPPSVVTPVEDLAYGPGALHDLVATQARVAVSAVPRPVELAGGAWVGHWAVTLAAAASQALAAGGSAILCVPDYRDQDQLLAALHAVLPADRVVQLDAKQSDPDRYRALLACRGDVPLAIVGTRAVLFAPAARLALTVVWDDGDPLHAGLLSPHLHDRDVALVRQEQQGGALVFAAHSRSTDVERLVEIGFLRELAPTRVSTPKVVPTAQLIGQDPAAALARIPSVAWREATQALARGPVLVQVARPGWAPRLACAECGQSARCGVCDGPLGSRTRTSTPHCGWCGALAADWHCTTCEGTGLRFIGQGAGRTADDLGRAFPNTRIIVVDGDRPQLEVGHEPALVIATRGAEPIARGGYRAVLLLDGERMMARESLRVAEDCLRLWSNAAALAAPGSPVVLVGVGGPVASALATWRQPTFAASELAERRSLRFPPAVRVATVTGAAASVDHAIAAVSDLDGVDVLGPVEREGGDVRAIVRFDYAVGTAITAALRTEVIRAATSRRRRAAGGGDRPAPPTLRVRCDDIEPFTE